MAVMIIQSQVYTFIIILLVAIFFFTGSGEVGRGKFFKIIFLPSSNLSDY